MKKMRLFLGVFACGLMLSAFAFNFNNTTFVTEILYVSASANVGAGDDEKENATPCPNEPQIQKIWCSSGGSDCSPRDC